MSLNANAGGYSCKADRLFGCTSCNHYCGTWRKRAGFIYISSMFFALTKFVCLYHSFIVSSLFDYSQVRAKSARGQLKAVHQHLGALVQSGQERWLFFVHLSHLWSRKYKVHYKKGSDL